LLQSCQTNLAFRSEYPLGDLAGTTQSRRIRRMWVKQCQPSVLVSHARRRGHKLG
jgi:hypothetical protein